MRVRRANISPYQAQNFLDREKDVVESIPGFQYSTDDSISPEVLLTNTHTRVESIDLTNTRLIIHPNSGYDNFPYEFVKNCTIPIVIGNPIRAHAVAEYNLSCIMSHYTPLPCHKRWDKERKWPRRLLSELQILLIGHGHIGSIIENSLRVHSGQVTIYDPYKRPKNSKLSNLSKYDLVLVCASLNPSSHKLIDTTFLSQLKSDVVIINSARGEIIDQESLLTFLKNNKSAFAYLDVFDEEPFHNSFDLKNLHPTSHIAGVYGTLDQGILNFVSQILTDFTNLSTASFQERYTQSLLANRISNGFLL